MHSAIWRSYWRSTHNGDPRYPSMPYTQRFYISVSTLYRLQLTEYSRVEIRDGGKWFWGRIDAMLKLLDRSRRRRGMCLIVSRLPSLVVSDAHLGCGIAGIWASSASSASSPYSPYNTKWKSSTTPFRDCVSVFFVCLSGIFVLFNISVRPELLLFCWWISFSCLQITIVVHSFVTDQRDPVQRFVHSRVPIHLVNSHWLAPTK